MKNNMKLFAVIFRESAIKLWHERWNVLAGLGLFCVLVLIAMLLSGCVPATSINAPIAPNVLAVGAQQTAQAAQDQADQYYAQAAATAQAQTAIAFAPFAAGTQAAADLEIQRMFGEATITSAAYTQVAAATITAGSWTPTPNATQTAVFAASYMEATKQANLAIEDNQRIARGEINNKMRAVIGYAVAFILSIIGVIYAYVRLKLLAFMPNPIDERGKAQPMIEVINAISWDIEKATNGMIGATQKFLEQLPQITAERQDRVTAGSQFVDLNTRIMRRIPRAAFTELSAPLLNDPENSEPTDMQDADLLLPEWSIINGWDGQSRPLGLGRQGIITAQAASPHLLVSGKTGTGKTGFMLRTQATASLAKGYQVINLGFSDSGFGVFIGHPNYHSVKLDQASDIIPCLASVYRELKERKQLIGGASIEWDHWPNGIPPRPFVDLLIDELGNIAEDIYASEDTARNGSARTKELWRWISMIANEGRKVGIRFIAALQDPTAKSVDLRFRRNCTLVSFQQGDASQSSAFLGATGAELLQVGHFMARIDSLIIGGGFSPSDDEIKAYLRQHSAPQTPAPAWIEGVIVNQPTLPTQEQIKLTTPAPTMNTAEFVNALSEWEVRALDLYQSGLDEIAIVESVFAGDNPEIGKVAVADLIKRWRVVQGLKSAHQPEESQKTSDESRIRELHTQGKSVSAIIREIWGVKGGGEYAPLADKVKAVIGTSSSQQTPPNGLLSAI